MKPEQILDLPLEENDAQATTVRDFLKALLSKLWREEEAFSGKRPFGNSAWQAPVEKALIKAKVVGGELDENGYVNSMDQTAFDKIMQQVIATL